MDSGEDHLKNILSEDSSLLRSLTTLATLDLTLNAVRRMPLPKITDEEQNEAAFKEPPPS